MVQFYTRFVLLCFIVAGTITSYAQVSVTASGGTTGPTAYTTVKAAFDAINAGTHTGTITVSISGNSTETASAVLNRSGSGSASYTAVTVKPAAAATPTVSGNFDGPVIAIMGSNVTVDGSNNATTSRNLTVTNLDTSRVAAVAIASSGTNAVSNVTIKNIIARNAFVGIAAADETFAAGRFTNITIQNNSVQKTYYGIYVRAVAEAGNGNGVLVTGNALNSSGTDAIYNLGIYISGVDGGNVTSNTIGNFDPTEEGDDIGIWLTSGTKNTNVEKNRINNIGNTSGQGWGAHGITVTLNTTSANVRIANNFISNITGDGWDYTSTQYPLDNPMGIVLFGNQTGITVAFNTIYLTGSTLNQAGAMSAGIYVGQGSFASVVNNIVVNNLGLQGSTGYGAVGVIAMTAANQFTAINYNNYYVNPSGSGAKNVGQIATTGSATLALWQTATSANANSKNVNPVFVNAATGDLHLVPASNAQLDNSGTPVAGITTDIDGDTRNATTPDMGGDEFQGPTSVHAVDADVAFIRLMPNVVSADAVLRIQSKKAMNVNWVVTDAQGRVVMTFSRQLMPGQNDLPLQFSQISAGTYHITGMTDKGRTGVIKFIKQ
ncbi:MAG TPA: T9SS type A sorting domain-containing protein [Flavisolibacter sp.]